jgi:hypothetical protein
MNNIIDPITSKSYSILSNYGKSLLKKYILKIQSGGSSGGGAAAAAGGGGGGGSSKKTKGKGGSSKKMKTIICNSKSLKFPCQIPDTGESHNEPIAPVRITRTTIFKGRTAENEISLYKLFRDINKILSIHKSVPQRLGIVNVVPGVYNGFDGSLWEYIEGEKPQPQGEFNQTLQSNLYLLQAVAKLIGLTDLHSDNIIIKDDIPYCIDGEIFKIKLDNDHQTGLEMFYEFDETVVNNTIYKIIRKDEVLNLVSSFRRNINNFRILLGSTAVFSDYTSTYGEKHIYIDNDDIGRAKIMDDLQGWSLNTDETMVDAIEEELQSKIGNIRYDEALYSLKETIKKEIVDNNVTPHQRFKDIDTCIEHIIDCVNKVALRLYRTTGKVSYVPVFLCKDNHIYIQYTESICGEHPIACVYNIDPVYIHPPILERLGTISSGSSN